MYPKSPAFSIRALRLASAAISLAALAAPARADAPIVDFTHTGSFSTSITLGDSFSVAGPLDIVGLGFFDPTAGPIKGARQVGLWDSSGDLLASATVDPSTAWIVHSISGEGYWLDQRIAPVDLPVGEYNLGLLAQAGDLTMLGNPVPIAPVTFGSSMYDSTLSANLTDPLTSTNVGGGFFGPNAFIATPEFSTIAVMISGAGGMLAQIARQRRRQRKPAE